MHNKNLSISHYRLTKSYRIDIIYLPEQLEGRSSLPAPVILGKDYRDSRSLTFAGSGRLFLMYHKI